jgi:hypothetical protein
MTAADFDWDDDDWYDDMPDQHAKEEPDCGACNDSGAIYLDGGRRCRSCRPTRLEAWWSRSKWRYREWRFRRRAGVSKYADEPPF